MSNDVKSVVDEFVRENKLFTSVDISNHIKKNGSWASNRDVSFELNILFKKSTYIGYKKAFITVKRAEDLSDVQAALYLPINRNESDYANIQAKPMTPKDFDFEHGIIDLNLNIGVDAVDNEKVDKKVDDKVDDKVKSKRKSSFSQTKRSYDRLNFL